MFFFFFFLICFAQVYNLGTGRGYSVLEMVKAVEKASGKPVSILIVLTHLC